MRRTTFMFLCTCALLVTPMTAGADVTGPAREITLAPPQRQALREHLQAMQQELAELKAQLRALREGRADEAVPDPQPRQAPRARRAPRANDDRPRRALRDGQGRGRGPADVGPGDDSGRRQGCALRRFPGRQRGFGQGQAAPAPRGQLRRGGQLPPQLRERMHAPRLRGRAQGRMRGDQLAPRGQQGRRFAPDARGRGTAPRMQGMPAPRLDAQRFQGRRFQGRDLSTPLRREAIRRYQRRMLAPGD